MSRWTIQEETRPFSKWTGLFFQNHFRFSCQETPKRSLIQVNLVLKP